jgi:hypothetical protein
MLSVDNSNNKCERRNQQQKNNHSLSSRHPGRWWWRRTKSTQVRTVPCHGRESPLGDASLSSPP